jgi:Cu(I)/Ag(I) efflux system membrane fusion protein
MTGSKQDQVPEPEATPEPDPPAEQRESRPPPGARAMAVVRWILVIVMAVLAALSIAYATGLVRTQSASAAETRYYCPMHPQVVQDQPGECPICSMSLVPTAGAGGDEPRDARASPSKLEQRQPAPPASARLPSDVPGLVPVELGLDRVQLIGMRTARAVAEELVPELRTVGFVSADEARIARVHTRFSGWIERLAVATSGQRVRRGQLLASIYNLELLPAQQEYLTARRRRASGSDGESDAAGFAASLEEDARARLELLGMSRAEIDRIARRGKPNRTIAVSSPITGYVVGKNAVQGGYVQPGTELFEIADLSRVWVLADVYEHEIARISVGQKARVEIAAAPGARFEGKLAFLYPTVDPSTRTLRIRLELENRDQRLRPGMYGDVVIELGRASGVVVPSEALVDTGEFQYVFLARHGGRFEPRRVRAGARSGDRVQILEGVAPDDLVVTTANFLLDSESRLRAAIQGMPAAAPPAPHETHPVPRHPIEP